MSKSKKPKIKPFMKDTLEIKEKRNQIQKQISLMVLKESILLKLQAHRNFLLLHIKENDSRYYFNKIMEQIIDHVESGKSLILNDVINSLNLNLAEETENMKITRKKVFDMYNDIYKNMYNRWIEREDDLFFERI